MIKFEKLEQLIVELSEYPWNQRSRTTRWVKRLKNANFLERLG